jgi:hypothetical protein
MRRKSRPISLEGEYECSHTREHRCDTGDPAVLELAAGADLAITLYLAENTPVTTIHGVGLQTTYAAAGNALSDPELSAAETSTRYDWITHVEVSSSDADSQGAQGALLLEQRLQAARDRLSELARVKSIGAS